MRETIRGKCGKIRTRIPLLVALCASLHLGNVKAFSAPPYTWAIACVTNISFLGDNILVDSFNSTNAASSDWIANLGYGTYDMAAARAHASIGTDSDAFGAISVGNASIYGTVNTAPGGTVSVAINGYVGPLPQAGSGIQPGYSNDTMNVAFPDVVLPVGASGWMSIPNNYVIAASGLYCASSISNNLTINAPNVTIYVVGNISLNGTQSIAVASSATNITMYVGGPSIIANGNATGLNNLTQRASVLNILGLPTLTNISISSTNSACTIYAPEANFSLGGGGTYPIDFVGAIVVKSAQFSGHPAFHFDESLAHSMPLWISILPTNHAVQPGTNTTFAVSASGAYALGFQWFFNQTNLLAGATNSTLTLTNVQFTDAGSYSIVATGWLGSITSAPTSLIVYTNAAATLTSPTLLTNGLQFGITGVAGLNYAVQASTNLTNWVPLTTNQPPFTFADTNLPAFSQRFYRVVCFPQ